MPPSVPGHRERPRLSALLDRGLEDRARLILLSAPPGYGKTVALVGWLESREVDCAWLSLDPADNDLARFARYLVAAVRAVRPGVGGATEALFGPGTAPSPELVGATLLDEVSGRDAPFVVALDDYHAISAEPIHRLVSFLIEQGPPFAHFVLLTREDPPLQLARLRAHGRLVELRAGDLRYTLEEASAYLADAGVALEPELVERVVGRTDKWLTPFDMQIMHRTRGGIARRWKVDVLLLTTRGRRSGRERTVVLQFFPDGEAMIVTAANDGGASHPGWDFNLQAVPTARVEVTGRTIPVRAEQLPAETASDWWQRILRRAPGYERYTRATTRTMPVLRLVPASERSANAHARTAEA